MTDRVLALLSPAVAETRLVARGISRLCLPAVLWAALTCLTQPATAQGTVPKLTAGDAIGSAGQGFSVAVSADGSTAIVGGPSDNSGAGAAWIFTRSGGTWTEQQKLTVGDASGAAQLGSSVALSADGSTAIVGGPGDNGAIGAAWVFTRSGSVWSQQGTKLSGAGATGANCAQPGVVGSAELGYAVALSADGNTAIVGGWADNSALGAAWVFGRSGGVWGQPAKLCASDASASTDIMQGFAVALSDDGTTAIVGGPNDGGANNGESDDTDGIGAAWVFTRSGATWSQQGNKLVGTGGVESQQGFAVALSGDGNTAILGGPGQAPPPGDATTHTSNGAAWVFTRSGGTWSQQGDMLLGTQPTTTNSPGLGFSVALASDGNSALVGGPTDNANTGAAWVFARSGGTWTQQGNKLVFPGAIGAAGQATSVALSRDGSTAIVGGPLDQAGTGAAWVFVPYGGSAALTVSVTGGGSVTSSPSGITCPSTCSVTFGGGTSVNLTPTPTSGWSFTGWSGACSGSAACTVSMNAAQSVTATFAQFILTTAVSGSGTVTSAPGTINCPTTCSGGYAINATVTLTATPASGWVFAGWLTNGGSDAPCDFSEAPCTVTMDRALTVTAQFAQINYNVAVSVAGSGTVTSSPSGINCGSVCTANFASGTPVTLTATPGGGATFSGWSGACSGTGSCVVTVNSSASVTAMFSSPGGSSPTARTWVSGTLGNDANPCTRAAPCLTFAAALALTTPGGEIDVLDPGDYGPLTVTQSVTIAGDETAPGVVTPSGTGGIVVNAGASDVVSVRGLTFNGSASTGVPAIQFNSGARLIVQSCAIAGFSVAGIMFAPATGSAAQMDIRKSSLVNNGSGVLIRPAGGVAVRAALRAVQLNGNAGGGLRADGTQGSGTIGVTITDSTISQNSGNGINAVSGPGSVAIDIFRATIDANGAAGVQSNQANGATARVTVGGSTIFGNSVGVTAVGGGSLLSSGNNQVVGNTTNGSFTGSSASQ
jgi:hypothetical protein